MSGKTVTLHHASMIDWLGQYDGPLFDACVTDPPYHLSSIVKRFGGDGAASIIEKHKARHDRAKGDAGHGPLFGYGT